MAGCSYIASFIAGATISGRRHASAAVVSRLSARPSASLAIVLADAGAIRKTSALLDELEVRERLVLGQRVAGERAAQRVALPLVPSTGAPVMRGERRGADEALRASVWMTRTAWPALVARRVELQRLVGGDAAGDAEQHAAIAAALRGQPR